MKPAVETLFLKGARTLRTKLALGDMDHSRFCRQFSTPERLKHHIKCDCGIDDILNALHEHETSVNDTSPTEEPDYNEGWKSVPTGPDSRGWRNH